MLLSILEERRVIILIVVIVVTIFVMANTLFIFLFVPVKDVDISGGDSVGFNDDVEDLQLTFEANIMDLDINYLDVEDKLVDFNYTITGKVSYLAPEEIISDCSFTQSIGDGSLSVSIMMDVKGDLLGAQDLDINGFINIDPSLSTSIDAVIGAGKIKLQCQEGVALNGLDLETTTGSILVDIGGGE